MVSNDSIKFIFKTVANFQLRLFNNLTQVSNFRASCFSHILNGPKNESTFNCFYYLYVFFFLLSYLLFVSLGFSVHQSLKVEKLELTDMYFFHSLFKMRQYSVSLKIYKKSMIRSVNIRACPRFIN